MKLPERYKVLVITLSDRAYRGEYEDLSGPRVRDIALEFFKGIGSECDIETLILPDDNEMLSESVFNAVGNKDLILTTGGTGIGQRDITVDTIKPMLEKEIPGVMEYIRMKYGSSKPNALLSRGVAGVIGSCLIYTLPGSVRAVEEYMTVITSTLEHTFLMLYGIDTHRKG
jgi:molybdenum cofactor synthesis domain-containing protein